MITVKVGSKRDFEKSERPSPLESLEKLPGAIDAPVKALRAGEPGCSIEAIKQITEADTFRQSGLSPAMTSIS